MKQENKQLLLQDLCARLPYGVKIQGVNPDGEVIVEELFTIGIDGDGIFDCNMIELSNIKPYLFPLSSMTEKQKVEYDIFNLALKSSHLFNDTIFCMKELSDWFNKKHFDYRGLIEKGLAIDAAGLNIY